MQANAELKAELDAMRSKLATAPSATTTPPPRRNSAPSPKTPTPVSGPSKHERSQKPAPKKLAVSECSEDDFEEGEEEDDDDVDTDQDESEMDDEGKVDEGKKGVVKKTGQKKESKTKGGKKEDGTKVERKKKDEKTDDEELTEAAKNNRLRRVCEVKPSGRCGVDDETHARWAKGGAERLALRDQLESCDWDKDGTSRLNIHGTMTY